MKKITSMVLSIVMIFGLSGVWAEGATAVDKAEKLADLGLFRGTENGYDLDAPVTRAQAVTMAVRYMGLDGVDAQSGAVFGDVPVGHWAANAVYNAVDLGITKGTGATTFDPERQVTDLEFITFILRAIGFGDAEPDTSVILAENCGIVSGGYPREYNFTRTRMVEICYKALGASMASGRRICDYLAENGVIDGGKLPEDLKTAPEPTASIPSPTSTSEPSGNGGGGNGSGGGGSENKGGNASASLDFDVKLMNKIDSGGNIIFSPFSIKMVLMMAANGASGATKREILDTFGVSDLDAFNQSAKSASVAVESEECSEGGATRRTMEFEVGNSIWLNKDYRAPLFANVVFSQQFTAKVQEFFHGVSNVVGKDNKTTAVNAWIEEKTRGKIVGALPPDDEFNYLSALVNTIYFKAEWENQFAKAATQKRLFTNKNGTTTSVDFMNKTEDMGYFENSKFQAVEMPYYTGSDAEISMFVFLPRQGAGEINANDMSAVFANKTSERVSLSIPKFETDFKDTKIKEKLEQLGIVEAFSKERAQFDGTYNNTSAEFNAYIEFVMHQAYIEIDEDGTEAAAATVGGGGGGTAMPSTPKDFVADHPFTYVIRNNGSGDVYFMGKIVVFD
ncbi:MAG: S-layer homology domain-containing protein [Clostridiales bacterium]|jgi:serpin B|nr:S-layer homology domain-containing protein [Clostridiales bacterium]